MSTGICVEADDLAQISLLGNLAVPFFDARQTLDNRTSGELGYQDVNDRPLDSPLRDLPRRHHTSCFLGASLLVVSQRETAAEK
jgi:hypothetical protein